MANISSVIKSTRDIMRQDTGTGSDEPRILQLRLDAVLNDYIFPIPQKNALGRTDAKIPQVKPLAQFGSPVEIIDLFGGKIRCLKALAELEHEIFIRRLRDEFRR